MIAIMPRDTLDRAPAPRVGFVRALYGPGARSARVAHSLNCVRYIYGAWCGPDRPRVAPTSPDWPRPAPIGPDYRGEAALALRSLEFRSIPIPSSPPFLFYSRSLLSPPPLSLSLSLSLSHFVALPPGRGSKRDSSNNLQTIIS